MLNQECGRSGIEDGKDDEELYDGWLGKRLSKRLLREDGVLLCGFGKVRGMRQCVYMGHR